MATHIDLHRLQRSFQTPVTSFFTRATIAVIALMVFGCVNDDDAARTRDLPPLPTLSVDQLDNDVAQKFDELQKQLNVTPLDGHYNARYARLLHAYSLHAPAVVMYQRCRMLRPNDLECVYLEALTRRLLGDHEIAAELLSELLRRKPDFPRASVVLADTYRQQGVSDRALPLFERAVEANQGDLEATYGLAMSQLELGNLAEARAMLERLNSQGRNFGIVHAALATIHRQEGRPEAAAFSAAAATRFGDSKIPFVDNILWAVQDEQVGDQRLVREARTLMAKGSLREAADAFLKATVADPDNVSNHNSLIGIYGQLGNIAGVQRHFDKAREINPADVVPLVAMGTVEIKRGAFAAAQEHFEKVIELQPTHSEARTLKVYSAQLLGEPVDPAELRRALADDPTQTLAHYLLARHLASTESCAVALPHFKTSIRLESAQTPAFIAELVRCLVETGNLEEARAQIRTGRQMAQHYRNRNAFRAINQVADEFSVELGDGSVGDGGS